MLITSAGFIVADKAQAAQVQLGVTLPYPPDLAGFEAAIGRRTDIFLLYQPITASLDIDILGPIAAGGRTIQLSWEPRDPYGDPVNQPAYRLQNISRGDFDADIRRWARELRGFGYPVLFRPMCEMNGDWTSWSGTANGNNPADYIPAWRHVRDIFTQEGATNVKFVWSPNRDGDTTSANNTWNTYYPGDAYVDIIGMNGYNWGRLYTTPDWTSQWQSIDEVFGYSYDVAAARTAKPIMISETATTEVGGDKAQWIRDTFARLPLRFPRLISLTWFNLNKETDWRVQSSASSLAAFREAVALDAAAPSVSISAPASGATLSGTVTVSASAVDNRGVARVELYAGDRLLAVKTAAPYNFDFFTRTLANGSYSLKVQAYDVAGNSAAANRQVSVNNSGDRNYYFGWYDNVGMRSWIIIDNPAAFGQQVEVYIGGVLRGSYWLAPGEKATPMYEGLMEGPVKVVSLSGGNLLASQRIIFNQSFSELPAVAQAELAPEHIMTWYDQRTANMLDWIIVGNQGNQTAAVDIYIAGQLRGHYDIPAGGRATPTFPGVMDGPVRVVATNGQPLSVSQRVHFGPAFNETSGKPVRALPTSYSFTWYDQQTQGMSSWLLIGNQGDQTAEVDVFIGKRSMGHYAIPVGGRATPSFAGVMDGPVQVISSNGQPLIASQRTHYWDSFEEVVGAAPAELTNHQWFAWYDYATPGMITWILVGNQGTTTAGVDIKIGGVPVGHYDIAPGDRVTPVFPGWLNGPVEVSGSSGSKLIVSQRTHFFSSFDETKGRTL